MSERVSPFDTDIPETFAHLRNQIIIHGFGSFRGGGGGWT